MTSDEKQDHFNLIYEVDNSLVNESNKRIFLGSKTDKICRFCGLDETKTTFKNKAHVLPEFMVNKYFFSNFECDQCNSLFSLYESSSSSFGGIMNTFSRVKGKKNKIYKHKGENEKTITLVEDDIIKMYINEPPSSDPNDFKSIKVDSVNQRLKFNTNKYSYTPIHVYKTFIKIGVCLLNENELANYKNTIDWLVAKTELPLFKNNPLFTVYKNTGKVNPKHSWAVLMKKRKMFESLPAPTNVLLISYGLFSFQIFLPGNLKDNWLWQENKIRLPIEQHIVQYDNIDEKHVKIWVDDIDLSSNDLLKMPKDEFSIGYK